MVDTPVDLRTSFESIPSEIDLSRRPSVFCRGKGLDLDACIEKLGRLELLEEKEVWEVCTKLKEMLMDRPNVQPISAPVTVVGDIHGQFHDLVELFRVGGRCPDTNYLFLGDYVDRGFHSLQVIQLLVCLCVRYPRRITLLRGNHETRQITQVYGFYSECMRKYGNPKVWRFFTDLFDFLYVAAIVDDTIFCVHAGLSPSVLTIEQIQILDRFHEVPPEGALADLVWSDPDPNREGFNQSNRGAGYTFGVDIVERFLYVNNMHHILRAHQLCMEGYQVLFNNTLSTIWSAPNYCYRCGNMATVLEIDENLGFFFNPFGPAPGQMADIKAEQESAGGAGGNQKPDYFL